MSYYHELYVVCDECHTSLLVDEATYEDADNDAADEGGRSSAASKTSTIVRATGMSNVMTAMPPAVGRRTSSNVRGGGSIATIRVTASVPNAPNLPDGELQLVRS